MNFTEVVDAVIEITGRPDKLNDIRRSVNAVLGMAVMKAVFTKDLVEVTTPIQVSEEYNGVIDLSLFTNFRKIKYIRPTTQNRFLQPKQPEGMFLNQTLIRDTYWIGGTSLNWVVSKITPSFEIGYYVHSGVLSDASPNHWMLDANPWCIIDFAAARTFQQMGDNPSSGTYQSTAAQLYLTMKNDMEDAVTPLAQ